MQKKTNFEIISFYKFIVLKNLIKYQIILKKFLIDNKLKGTIILSPEGINGTISGTSGFVPEFSNFIFSVFDFNQFDSNNLSQSNFLPFERPKVKIKKEVVPLDKKILERKGRHISPREWNDFVKKDDVLLIDIRKPFEYEIGTFIGAKNPNVSNFREFKGYFDNLITKNNKKLAIFCTGGIRCEKASEYLSEKGIDDVYQLDGGILNYINNIPEEDSLWKGECFVFDKRVAVKHGSKPGSYSMCYGCRMPINNNDKKSPKYEQGISCHHCFDKLTIDKKKRFAMREYNKNMESDNGEQGT